MFETVSLQARTDDDGHLRLDLPLDLPPNSAVHLLVTAPKRTFANREEWEADAERIVGSIPDIERPEQWPIREIEPL